MMDISDILECSSGTGRERDTKAFGATFPSPRMYGRLYQLFDFFRMASHLRMSSLTHLPYASDVIGAGSAPCRAISFFTFSSLRTATTSSLTRFRMAASAFGGR